MRSKVVIIATCLATAATTSVLMAQQPAQAESDSFLQQQRLIDQQLHEQRQKLAPIDARLDWQWGGWLEYYLFHFDDGIQSSRVFHRPGMWVWTRLRLDDGAHEAFARVKLTYQYFKPGDQYDRQVDWVGPNFDRAWYQIDVGKALRLTKPSDPYQLRARIGRQSAFIGTGYVLDMPLDAVLIEGKLHDLRVMGLFGKTIASYPNLDRSPPVADHSGRHFYGVQMVYDGLENHQPFAYALWNQDHTDERPVNKLQEFSYDSQYFGIGSRGEIGHALNYWVEAVFESGHSYGDGNWRRQDYIEAYGWDIGLEYLFEHETRPRVSLEYMFASGDQDRMNPTSAVGGNRGGGKDSSFAAFGYRDTGIAAGLINSNLHIWRAGASFVPLAQHELFEHMELGTNWFLYHKNRAAGGISDPTTDRYDSYVGWEMDYFVNWRFASDLSWTARWGVFFPGDAYVDREARHFVFTGITWSF